MRDEVYSAPMQTEQTVWVIIPVQHEYMYILKSVKKKTNPLQNFCSVRANNRQQNVFVNSNCSIVPTCCCLASCSREHIHIACTFNYRMHWSSINDNFGLTLTCCVDRAGAVLDSSLSLTPFVLARLGWDADISWQLRHKQPPQEMEGTCGT